MEFPDRINERHGSEEGPMVVPTKTLVKCGSLNIIDLHKLKGTGTIRRHSFVGRVASLWVGVLRFPMLRLHPVWTWTLPIAFRSR